MLNNAENLNGLNSKAERIDKIKSNELNCKSLMLLSKLSRKVKEFSGTVISMRDNSLTAMNLTEHLSEIKSPELNALYRSFLNEAIKSNDHDLTLSQAH